MGEEIRVAVHDRENAKVIDLVGDVTTFAEEAIRRAYQDVCADGAHNVVLNFHEDDYINSAGIAILINIVTEARKRDQRLIMSGLSEHFQRIFRMVGLAQYAELHTTLDEAIASFGGN
jgi:anti-anti-sigma factor